MCPNNFQNRFNANFHETLSEVKAKECCAHRQTHTMKLESVCKSHSKKKPAY